jgi:hypothetical protein
MQTQPHPRDPGAGPLPAPRTSVSRPGWPGALARMAHRARDAAAEYHRAQPPLFRTACRAPSSGFPRINRAS